MTTAPESRLTKKLIDCIKLTGGHARKVHVDGFTGAGEPDIDACVRGRCVKVEVKVPGKKPTPLQFATMRKWEAAGALAGWVTSVDALVELLSHVDDREWRNPQLSVASPGSDLAHGVGQ